MKVFERFGMAKQTGLLGMEIEVEGEGLPQELPYYWLVTKDGSLRGESAEYVLKKAFNPSSVIKAIDHLVKATKGSKLNFSHRTSVHVHVNVQELSRNQLINFIYLSYLFDRVLDRIGGREIKGNRFCLRIADAEEQIFMFKKFVSGNEWYIPDMQRAKYSAVNIVPVVKYGSVEFRSMRGTLDPEVLKSWISIIHSLYTFSLKFNTIQEMLAGFVEDEKEFCKQIFSNKIYNQYILHQNLYEELRMNYSLLLDIMFSVKYDKEIVEDDAGKGIKAAVDWNGIKKNPAAEIIHPNLFQQQARAYRAPLNLNGIIMDEAVVEERNFFEEN